MVFEKRDEGYNQSETGNWNVASDYSKLKIMKYLYLADQYEITSTFGTLDFIEELQISYNVDDLKIRAFQRLIKNLLMLIDNSIFAIKQKGDQKTLNNYKKDLEKIKKVIPALYKRQTNQKDKTNSIVILPEEYNKVLDKVIEIKSGINIPLNKSHLIFTDKDEYDPKKHKAKMLKDLSTTG